MPTLGKHLRDYTKANGRQATYGMLTEALSEGLINPATDVSIRELAESMLGPDWALKLKATSFGEHPLGMFPEAGDAVDSSMFADITGQILFQEIKAQYNAAEFIGDNFCRTMPVTNKNLGEEKIPYLSTVADRPPHVQQGMPYPRTQFTQQYVILPPIVKFGEICQVTMEMIFSDHTLQAREAAGKVGEATRITKEELQWSTILGLTTSYKFNSSTAAATYQASTPYVNLKSSTPLVDANSVNTAEQLLGDMVDPVSGKAIRINPTGLVVMPANYRNARRIMGSSEVRVGDGASTSIATYSPDMLDDYPVYKTRYGYNLLIASATPSGNDVPGGGLSAANAKEYWFLGDFKKAFVWRQAMPLQTFVAPPQSPEEFNNDIVLQVKAREWGSMGVYDPRYVVKLYNA